jgi:GPH family glycoside/pentoside/hexuronide:cation symporter
MRWAFIPLSLFSALIFFPHPSLSSWNIFWLAAMQLLFYFFFGLYTIPYNALLADIGHDNQARLHLSTAQSVGFMIGALFGAASPLFVKLLMGAGVTHNQLVAYQYAIVALNIVGMVSLAVPAFLIDEKKYADPDAASKKSLFESLKTTLSSHNFRIFALADACYFMSIAIISAGLMYYVTAMLKLDEALGTAFMLVMVLITLLCYVLVNRISHLVSKKKMMVVAFSAAAVVFSEIFFLGRLPFPPLMQASLLVITFGIPNAFLQILPNTVIADIAHAEGKKNKENSEAMFFGMRAFFQKIGQTMGVTIFGMLTLFGKDPGHDWGLRLSGVAGATLCALAAIAYSRYEEETDMGIK